MAFSATYFQRLAGGVNGLFYYQSADAVATVIASGYFNSVTSQLKQWDVIMVVNTALPSIDNVIITSATGAATVTSTAVEGSTAT